MKKTFKLLFISLLVLSISSCSEDDDTEDVNIEEGSIEENIDEENPTVEEEKEETVKETENPGTKEEEEEEEEEEEIPQVGVSNSVVGTYGQLSVSGKNIVDKNNNAVQLRGMSLFWSQWDGDQYYNQTTVKWLKDDWHATIVRAAMGVEDNLGYITNPEKEKEKVFAVIDAAIAEGIYVIVDWHSHNAEKYLTQSKTFFAEVALKYGSYPNIIYETYNEPIFKDQSSQIWQSTIKPYHEKVIAEIRKYDPDNIIVCGTRQWSQLVSEVIGNEIKDDNVAYTLHYYSSTHLRNGLVWQEAEKAINAGLPLFVTEFGVTSADGNGTINAQQAGYWWDFLDENKISWCNWSIVDKDEASASLFPGTTTNNLSVNNLTTSGGIVYNEMIEKNKDFK